MTIGARLTVWYATVLLLSVLVLGGGLYYELVIERRAPRPAGTPAETVEEEINEVVFLYAVPAVLLTLIGGWWLTRKALAPINRLTRALERLSAPNLAELLPRSGNGDELDRLTGILNAMLERLGRSFAREREFTLHASHELKTPLTIMRSQAETALREDSLTPAQREILASHIDEIERLAAIIDNLTLLAKADAGQLELRRAPVRLDELVREAVDDARILGAATELEVSLDARPAILIHGDRHRLRQTLVALTDNAVKFTPRGGRIWFALRHEGHHARLEVTNTGAGIPPEQLPRVFDRFYRGDPAHGTRVEGTGLGLSVAHWIVTAHGGSIEIQSRPGRDTTVAIQLPLASGAQSA